MRSILAVLVVLAIASASHANGIHFNGGGVQFSASGAGCGGAAFGAYGVQQFSVQPQVVAFQSFAVQPQVFVQPAFAVGVNNFAFRANLGGRGHNRVVVRNNFVGRGGVQFGANGRVKVRR